MGLKSWAKLHKELKAEEKKAKEEAFEAAKGIEKAAKLEKAKAKGKRKGELKAKGVVARAKHAKESAGIALDLFAGGLTEMGKIGETYIASQEEMEKQFEAMGAKPLIKSPTKKRTKKRKTR